MPAGKMFENRFNRFHPAGARRHLRHRFTVHLISNANGNALKIVQDIKLGDNQAVEAVHFSGVAKQRNIEPAAAARPSCDGAELVPGLADLLA